MEKNIKVIENNANESVTDFYASLRQKIKGTHTFPTDYLFKYVSKADSGAIEKLQTIFENSGGKISVKDSSGGKYKSFTAMVPVNDVDDVMIYYRQAAEVSEALAL